MECVDLSATRRCATTAFRAQTTFAFTECARTTTTTTIATTRTNVPTTNAIRKMQQLMRRLAACLNRSQTATPRFAALESVITTALVTRTRCRLRVHAMLPEEPLTTTIRRAASITRRVRSVRQQLRRRRRRRRQPPRQRPRQRRRLVAADAQALPTVFRRKAKVPVNSNAKRHKWATTLLLESRIAATTQPATHLEAHLVRVVAAVARMQQEEAVLQTF